MNLEREGDSSSSRGLELLGFLKGLGFRVSGLGIRVSGLGFRVGFRV